MSVDAAFNGAGQKAGLELWRIENKLVVKQPEVSDTHFTRHVHDTFMYMDKEMKCLDSYMGL